MDERHKNDLRELMNSYGLGNFENSRPSELSGGMRRRVALLRALLAPCQILFLDEPFKGLDDETRRKTIAYTKEACRGRTVLFVTHDEKEAELMGAVKVVSLDEGQMW